MSIRDAAAREVAASILGPFVPASEKTDTLVDLAASMIIKAVQADELAQEIEVVEARIASKVPA